MTGPTRATWDERYGAPGFVYGTDPNDFLVACAARLPRGGLALSLAEGEGRNAVFLAAAGWRVIGIDASRVGLRKAWALAAQRGVAVAACVADLAAFPLPEAHFDLVISVFCHLPSAVRGGVYRSVVRALRPGGALVLEAYTPRQLAFRTGGPSDPDLLVTLEQLRPELRGLEIVVGRECERNVVEGRHRGIGAVVQVMAVRPGTPHVTAALDPAAVAALRGARRVVVLTGAGISAESGIPTFRDALTGLWATYRAEDLATPEAFARQPGVVWDWYHSRRESVRRAEPNAGHRALVDLGRRVPRFTLVTQNIDGLHQRAGSTDVIELHGNILRSRCSREGTIVEDPLPAGSPPPCPRCGAPLRPDVVWFGELLPLDALAIAEAAAAECDVLLSVGTSNLVVPAANIPWIAAARGATVIVVNTTDEGQRRGPGIHSALGPAGVVLPALVTAAWPNG